MDEFIAALEKWRKEDIEQRYWELLSAEGTEDLCVFPMVALHYSRRNAEQVVGAYIEQLPGLLETFLAYQAH